MHVVLCSAFRDSAPYLDRYLAQVEALGEALAARGDSFAMVWGEGDSLDPTRFVLARAATVGRYNAQLVDCTHGGAAYGSVVDAQRFKQLAYVGRRIFAAIPHTADVVIWVESDLIWGPATLLGLIEHVKPGAAVAPCNRPEIAAVAPPILLQRRGWPPYAWYDTLAFVANGSHFAHNRPWHPRLVQAGAMVELDTAGSCLAMRGDYARRAVMNDRVLMGMCEQFREMGGSVWLDLTVPAVVHE